MTAFTVGAKQKGRSPFGLLALGVFIVCAVVALTIVRSAHAATTCTWDGAVSTDWGKPGNWTCAGDNPLDHVPIATDDVVVGGSFNVNINVAAVGAKLTWTSSGTLSFSGSNTLTIGAGGIAQSAGTINAASGGLITVGAAGYALTGSATFTGSTPGLTVNGPLSDTSSGAFTVGASTLTVSGDLTMTPGGTFTATGSTLALTGAAATINPGTGTWVNVTLNATDGVAKTIATNTLTMNGTLLLTDGKFDGTIEAKGAVTQNSTFDGGTGSLLINSTTGGQTLTGGGSTTAGDLPAVTIAKSAQVLNLAGVIRTTHNWTFTSGGTTTAAASTSLVFAGGGTISGATSYPANATFSFVGATTLGSDITVNGPTTFDGGILTTSTNTYYAKGAVTRPGTGHVSGNLKKDVTGTGAVAYQVGGATSYRPVTVTINAVTDSGTLTARNVAGDHSSAATSGLDTAKSVNAFWTFTQSGLSGLNYDMAFTYVSGDVDGGATPANFKLGKLDAGTWTKPTVSGTPTSTSLTATGMTSFSDFWIAEAAVVVDHFVVTGTGTQTAGGANAITVTAKDVGGATVTGYTGDHAITFSGAASSPGPVTVPTVTDKTPAAVNFGTATTITFTAGVSSAGGSMILYKAETALIVATEGAVTTTAGNKLSVVVTHADASKLAYTTQPSATTVAGIAFATQPVVTVQDAFGNTVTTTADATVVVTIAKTVGTGTLAGTLTKTAVAGVADFAGQGLNIDLVGSNKVLQASATLIVGARTADTSAFTITQADVTAPAFSSAAVNGSTLTVTFNESLAGASPAAGDFVVQFGGVSQAAPTSIGVSGTTVTLTLASAATSSTTVTVGYNQGANPVKDAAGNATASFGQQAVTNNTAAPAPAAPAPAPAPSGGGGAVPAIVNVSPADGSTITSVCLITLTANKSVQWTSITVELPNRVTVTLDPAFGTNVARAFPSTTPGLYTIRSTISDGGSSPVSTRSFFTIFTPGTPGADPPPAEIHTGPGQAETLLSSDGLSSVSWSGTTFSDDVVVRTDPTPTGSTPNPQIFTDCSRVLQVTATRISDGASITSFNDPLDIEFPNADAALVPAFSTDGIVWRPLQLLPSHDLPAGQQDGYFRDGAGTVHILTRHLTFFGLLARSGQATQLMRIASAKRIWLDKRHYVAVQVQLSVQSSMKVFFVDPRGRRTHISWTFRRVRAGTTILRLPIPRTVSLQNGTYKLQLRATARGATVGRTASIDVLETRPATPFTPRSKTPGIVVLKGDEFQTLTLNSRYKVSVLTSSEVFWATGIRRSFVEAVVVDLDRQNVALVTGLRHVFPELRILVVTNDKSKAADARRAGATLVVLKPASERVVSALLQTLIPR